MGAAGQPIKGVTRFSADRFRKGQGVSMEGEASDKPGGEP